MCNPLFLLLQSSFVLLKYTSISLSSDGGDVRRNTTIIWLLDDTKVWGGMKAPKSFRAFLDVGEQTLKRDFLCPFGVTSIISITLRHEGDLEWNKNY